MEFVLAFLLFFGGLALGQNSADKEEGELSSTTALLDADDVPDLHQLTQAARHSDSSLCYSDHGTIYRDLTEPYLGQPEQRESPPFCDGDCPDE